MAPSLNQRGELIYPNLSLKWLNPGRAERRQSLERATQAMVNEIGYPRKMRYAAAPMLALAQLIILNGRRPGFWVSIGEWLRQAGHGPVQEKEERHE